MSASAKPVAWGSQVFEWRGREYKVKPRVGESIRKALETHFGAGVFVEMDEEEFDVAFSVWPATTDRRPDMRDPDVEPQYRIIIGPELSVRDSAPVKAYIERGEGNADTVKGILDDTVEMTVLQEDDSASPPVVKALDAVLSGLFERQGGRRRRRTQKRKVSRGKTKKSRR